jgi:UDP-N-acetyl-D-glucosamine dehydrogenase
MIHFCSEDSRLVSGDHHLGTERKGDIQTVAIQGLGFVGAAMAIAVANAVDSNGNPYFNVIGVDLPTRAGRDRVARINSGLFPFRTVDEKIVAGIKQAVDRGNLRATTDNHVFGEADIILVSVNLDLSVIDGAPTVKLDAFRNAICTLGKTVKEGTLIIIETTVPPGTCEHVVKPIMVAQTRRRGLDIGSIHLAHSYERVMPGANYLDSITNFWRVYAGLTVIAADKCEAFLSKIIHVDKYPLTRLKSTIASEIGKVLENSYRAVNIAFIEEWARFAEETGVDLYEVIDAVRLRPTHSNMREPGFGVGGYCLTKDPLFAKIAAREIFGLSGHDFLFSSTAVEVNRIMPLVTLRKLKEHLHGSLRGKRILLMGISYRQDVGDTRFSPAEAFIKEAKKEGAQVIPHDPLVDYWEETRLHVHKELPDAETLDAVVFAVPHQSYRKIDIRGWLKGNGECLIVDANNVLTDGQRSVVRQMGNRLVQIGRG